MCKVYTSAASESRIKCKFITFNSIIQCSCSIMFCTVSSGGPENTPSSLLSSPRVLFYAINPSPPLTFTDRGQLHDPRVSAYVSAMTALDWQPTRQPRGKDGSSSGGRGTWNDDTKKRSEIPTARKKSIRRTKPRGKKTLSPPALLTSPKLH